MKGSRSTPAARIAALCLTVVCLGAALVGAQAMNRKERVQAFAPKRPQMQQALGAQGDGTRWWNTTRMIDRLKLTDDQRKAMDQIFYDYRAKLIDLHANLQKSELGMQQLMNADQPDQKAMETQIDKVVAARGDLERANSRFLLSIRMKLTPDQWKLLRDVRAVGAGQANPPPPMQQKFRDRPGDPGAVPPAPPAGGPAGPPPGQVQ